MSVFALCGINLAQASLLWVKGKVTQLFPGCRATIGNRADSFAQSVRYASQEGSMLRIWGRKNSINVQKVLWCCAELELAFERIDAGMAFGVTETPAYRTLNPNGRIPTIEDDGYVLWESNAIVRYLATKHGFGSLCPSDLAARFDCERWMDWQQTTLDPPMRTVFWTLVRTPPDKRDPVALEKAQTEAERAFAILDAHLGRRRFVGGESFTMGDIPVGAFAHRWLAMTLARAERPQLRRWYERLTERQGFREHVMQPLS
jgi:glutathione S-transferase